MEVNNNNFNNDLNNGQKPKKSRRGLKIFLTILAAVVGFCLFIALSFAVITKLADVGSNLPQNKDLKIRTGHTKVKDFIDDEDEPDETEPDEDEPDETEPDETEPDETEPDETKAKPTDKAEPDQTEPSSKDIATPTPRPTPTHAPLPDGAAEWTVMIYLCGTNLETEYAFASQYLSNLINITDSDKVNFVVETGGATAWNNKTSEYVTNDALKGVDIPADSLVRYKAGYNTLTEIEKVPLASMGEKDTLRDFVTWGKENYPARKYLFIFWDHGYVEPYGNLEHDELFWLDDDGSIIGPEVSAIQQQTLQNDCLSLDEIQVAFKEADIHFDLIGFNTCLSSSIEVASAVAPYADYMVASEESIPAVVGIPLGFGQMMVNDPSTDAKSIGQRMLKDYSDYIAFLDTVSKKDSSEPSDFSKGTMSLIDLSIMPQMEVYYENIMENLYYSTYDQKIFSTFQSNANICENYGSEGFMSGNLIDLYSFLDKNSEYLKSTNADDKIMELIDYGIECVLGSSRYESKGLSFFYPSINYINGIRSSYETELVKNGISYTPEQLDLLCSQYVKLSFDGYTRNIQHLDGYFWYASYLEVRFADYWSTDDTVKKLLQDSIDNDHQDLTNVSASQSDMEYELTFDDKGNISLDFKSGAENVISVDTNIVFYFMDDKGDANYYMFLGSSPLDPKNDGTKYEFTFDRTGLLYDDHPFTHFITENTDYYTTYCMPADINGVWKYVFIQYEKSTGEYKYLYAIPYQGLNNLANVEMESITEDTVITPLTYAHIFYINPSHNYVFGSSYVHVGTFFEDVMGSDKAPVTTGEFQLRTGKELVMLVNFLIRDPFGNIIETKAVEFTYDVDRNLVSVKEAEGYDNYGNLYDLCKDE